ncbi:MAG: efflux RND transporter periplasmic adaptor subunit [Magnetovibrio sp.]|nr:efflux RND transporter periplasmic adaptor subunit [Magnetovibrio sp.]
MFSAPLPGLPNLRDDLELLSGPRARGGAPTWTIHDPVRNRYFRIGKAAFELLSRWHLGDWDKIASAVAQSTGSRPPDGERDWLVQFLNANMLIRRESASDVADMDMIGKAAKTGWIAWGVHHYLFFRIPLVRPQRFLDATLPFARRLMSKSALIVVLLIGVLGGYLTVSQWDAFLATFLHFSTAEGFVWYGLALVVAKILHELGHAYTAARFGCRVPTMGLAFLVMWPVLYTDTSDAWRLTSKKERLAIGGAGMMAELALAVVATLMWNFLPDGPVRSAAFITATVTWIMTLTMNLNPFMRFDGYYLLSDALDVENLQDRAFAHARWWIRERLFGFGETVPEPFPVGLGRILLAYAIATWVYRLILFLGIAVLVYTFFFKLLGIALFGVEMVWFIGLPVLREGAEWWKRRDAFQLNRNAIITGSVFVFALGVLVVPWRTSISVSAVLQASERTQVYAPVASRVQSVQVGRGDSVAKDEVLLTLVSPDLDHKIAQAQRRVELVQIQVRREAAGGSEAENIRILQRRLTWEISTLHGLKKRQDVLTVRAPLAGTVTDLEVALEPGLWVNVSKPLARVVNLQNANLYGFVDERDLRRIALGAKATFYPDDPAAGALKARLVSIADVNSRVLDIPYLASIHGGDVAVKRSPKGALIPMRGIYRITMALQQSHEAPTMVQRGVVHIQGTAQSLLMRAWNRVWGVLMRESGF